MDCPQYSGIDLDSDNVVGEVMINTTVLWVVYLSRLRPVPQLLLCLFHVGTMFLQIPTRVIVRFL